MNNHQQLNIIRKALSQSHAGLGPLDGTYHEEAAKQVIENLMFHPWEHDGEKVAFVAHVISMTQSSSPDREDKFQLSHYIQ